MPFSAKELSEILDGTIEGDPDVIISKPSKIETGEVGTVSFIANSKYNTYAKKTKASILIVDKSISFNGAHPTLIRVKDPYAGFSKILELFDDSSVEKKGLEEPVFIHKSAKIGKNVYVGTHSYIAENVELGDGVKVFPNTYIGENVKVSDNTILYPGIKIYKDCIIGKNCIVHSGVVIGSDGFGFVPLKNGSYKKIVQIGNVVIEDNVEIGANTTIDRATLGSTIIRKGVKLDNLIMVAHNVEIGENTVIAAQTGISGSTKIGKQCAIAGQVGLAGHIVIADGSTIGAQSGVPRSLNEPGKTWFGSPTAELKETIRSYVLFRNLPKLEEKIKEIEKKIKKILDK